MQPLRLAGWGLLLVFVDIRIDGVDVIPDLIGWVLAVVAMSRLQTLHAAFAVARTAAGAGVLVNLAIYLGADAVLVALEAITVGVFVFAVCTGLLRRAAQAGDAGTARAAQQIRWAHATLTALSVVGLLATGGQTVDVTGEPGFALVLIGALAVLALLGWLIYLLFSRSDREYLETTQDTQLAG